MSVLSDFEDRHPAVAHVAKLLHVNENLPEDMRLISEKFAVLRDDLLRDIKTDTPEVTEGLRKVLEAKDCFVRAALLAKQQVVSAVDDFKAAGEGDTSDPGKGA